MGDTEYKIQLLIDAHNVASAEITKLQKQLREVQGQASKTTDMMSQSFSSFSSMLGQIKTAAIIAGIAAVGNSIKKAIDIEPIRNSFEQLSASAGIASDEMLKAMRKASLGTVSDFNLMSVANKAYSLGVVSNTEQMTTLMEIARVKGSAMGRTMNEALDDIVTGLGRGSAMILDNLGIVVNQKEAQEQYAQSVGKTVEQLSEAEKKQALVNKVVADGKAQLEEMGEIPLTFSDRLAQMVAQWENMQVVIGEALLPTVGEFFTQTNDRIEEHMDLIRSAIDVIASIAQDAFQAISGSIGELRTTIVETVNLASQLITDLFINLGILSTETSSGIAGDFSDLVYFFQQGFTVIASGVQMLVSAFRAGASVIGNMFSAVIQNIVKKIENMVNNVISAWNWLSSNLRDGEALSPWASGVAGYAEAWDTALANMTDTAISSANNIEATWNKMGDKMINTYAKKLGYVSQITHSTTSNLLKGGNKLEDLSSPTDKSSKSSKSEKNSGLDALKKEMEEYAKETKDLYKSIQKESENWLNNQVKNINDLDKEFQKSFDKIQDKIDETTKNIENLTQEIGNLKQKLVDLQTEQTTSIAKEYVNAKKELQALEEQYKGLKEVADGVSREDLKGVGGIGKYDVDLIKKYKDYQDEMKSAYTGLSEEERKAMDEQIAYQERYRSLNNIEKIKEDYRIKKEEAQAELDQKIAALNLEQDLLRTHKKEQQQLQDQWIKRINEEIAKRQEVADKKKEFEKKYMEILEINHQKQVDMTNKLVDQRNAVYRAKMRAMSAGSADGSRASGGPVYQGNAYLVGETGPELFVPSSHGKIVKNSDLGGGGGNISVNVNLGNVSINNGSDEQSLTQKITDAIVRELVLYRKGII